MPTGQLIRFSCVCLAILPPSPALTAEAQPLLRPFEAEFQVKRNSINLGTLKLQLSLTEKGGYRFRGHTKPTPLLNWFVSAEIHEISEGNYQDRRIIPLTYEYRQSNGEPVKQTLLEFDWSAAKVWTESEGKRWSQPIQANAHDKLSQQLALRLDLSNGIQEVSYAVADGGRIKTYHYRVEGDDFIQLPYGPLKCLRVRRSKEARAPDYTIWFAPELDYLPVKIERQRSSGRYSMELKSIRSGG